MGSPATIPQAVLINFSRTSSPHTELSIAIAALSLCMSVEDERSRLLTYKLMQESQHSSLLRIPTNEQKNVSH